MSFVTFEVFTYFESCTGPFSTNPESMEAVEYRLTRGICVVARRLEVHRSPGPCRFRGVFWVRRYFAFFSECTRPAASIRPPCLIYLSTSISLSHCYITVLRALLCSIPSHRHGAYNITMEMPEGFSLSGPPHVVAAHNLRYSQHPYIRQRQTTTVVDPTKIILCRTHDTIRHFARYSSLSSLLLRNYDRMA